MTDFEMIVKEFLYSNGKRVYTSYDKTFSYHVGSVIKIFDFNYDEYNVEGGKGI